MGRVDEAANLFEGEVSGLGVVGGVSLFDGEGDEGFVFVG